MSPTNIFAPASTPAQSIFDLSIFTLLTVAAIFIAVFALLAYAVVRFRNKRSDDRSEPAQFRVTKAVVFSPGALGPGIAHCPCRVENVSVHQNYRAARMPAYSKVADASNSHLDHLD